MCDHLLACHVLRNFVTKTMMTCGPYNSTNCDIAKTELKTNYRAQNGLTGCTGPLMCTWDGQKRKNIQQEPRHIGFQEVLP